MSTTARDADRETLDVDVLIIGAGPAGLSAAIRLKQLCRETGEDVSVCVLEKASQLGAHTVSGAVLDPKSLTELLPDWREAPPPGFTEVTKDYFYYLNRRRSYALPVPPSMGNEGNYIISISQLCVWLGQQAEALGVDIYTGFAATELLRDGDAVTGVITGDMGVDKQGEATDNYQPGIAIRAKQTLFSEGCRGSLTQQLIQTFKLAKDCEPQTYGIGIKELWRVDPAQHRLGTVSHTVGWPLDRCTYGGSFIYHWDQNRVAVGFVVGLDYKNPYLNPFEELQRFKSHRAIQPLFEGGERLAYGARALNEGGYQSIPALVFPGGLLMGDGAGFLNVPRIKGIHTAMKSAQVAAEAVFDGLQTNARVIEDYPNRLKATWLMPELYRARNIRPGFRWGLWPGLVHAAVDTYVLRGRAPWTLGHPVDHKQLKPKRAVQPIDYPKPDNRIRFDKLSSVALSNTFHAENQPCHLQLREPAQAIALNWEVYGSPEQYYCPANVYEIVYTNSKETPQLQINASNCVHCKTCDIKDPSQNIVWVPPEGGGGPGYSDM